MSEFATRAYVQYAVSAAGLRGERGAQGPVGPQGPAGSLFAFEVDGSGHLIMHYTGDAPDMAINGSGHLIYTF